MNIKTYNDSEEVPYGTDFSKLGLPAQVVGVLEPEGKKRNTNEIGLRVDWNEEDYSPTKPGKQSIRGTLVLPENVTNSQDIKPMYFVTVQEEVLPEPEVDGIKVSPMSKSLKVGETFKITATTTPPGVESHVLWTADNEDAVDMTVSGKTATVTAKESGTVYVVAQVKDNSELRAETVIKITEPVKVKSIKLNPEKLDMVAEEYQAVEVIVDPVEAADKIVWTNGNSDLIYLVEDENKTRAQLYGYKEGAGKVTVHIEGQEAMKAVLDVNVSAKPEPEPEPETEEETDPLEPGEDT